MRLSLRLLSLCLVCMLIVPLAGCWNKRELNELAIVYGIGIDKVENSDDLEVSFQIINPNSLRQQGGTQESPIIVISAQGKTVHDAIRNNLIQLDRKLFLFSNKIIVIDENVAQTGVQKLLDLLIRDHESRVTAQIVIARGTTAKQILGVEKGVQNIQASYLEDMINSSNKHSIKSTKSNLLDFYKTLLKQGIEPTVGVATIFESENLPKEQEEEKTSKSIKYHNVAIFQEDRLIGYFDEDQTIGYNFITNTVGDSIISVEIDKETQEKLYAIEKKAIDIEKQKDPEAGQQKEKDFTKRVQKEQNDPKLISTEINNSKTKLSGSVENGKVHLNIIVDVYADISEATFSQDFTNIEVTEELEKALAKNIESTISQSINKAQELKVDAFGFGLMLHRQDPKAWKEVKENWNEKFVEAKVTVKVSSTLHDSGFIFKSYDD